MKEDHHPVVSVLGIYFCTRCENMMTPHKDCGPVLEFKCLSCGIQELDFTRRVGENCMLYSKELQADSKKEDTMDTANILDPTLPTVQADCPECGFKRGIYELLPDVGQTKILIRMTCANVIGTTVKCGHSWILDDKMELHQTVLIQKGDLLKEQYD